MAVVARDKYCSTTVLARRCSYNSVAAAAISDEERINYTVRGQLLSEQHPILFLAELRRVVANSPQRRCQSVPPT
jgi:hypothetical protein